MIQTKNNSQMTTEMRHNFYKKFNNFGRNYIFVTKNSGLSKIRTKFVYVGKVNN